VRYIANAPCAGYNVEARLKAATAQDEESGEYEEPDDLYRDRILIEILAQLVASRRHLLIVATIAVLGVISSLICAIVIAVQVTEANRHTTVSSPCSILGC
jgi:hypothetical protein